MRITIAAIGKLKAGPERELADDYAARISGLGKKAGVTALSIREWAESQKPTAAQRMAEERGQLAAAIPKGAHVIALDERGKAVTSEAFAAKLQSMADGGTSEVVFLLGGPDGHAPDTRKQAQELIAFGPMTWPHRLARIMLLEQVYRSLTIILKHPYHRA